MESCYMCIDLKSFYASVECADLGLDPLTTNLVVADPSRGNGAICLAVTPALKDKGVRNRCRIFEIPKNIPYMIALPRMMRYMKVSAEIYKIYLRYVSKDDIHVYSIDECFIDVTKYLKLYNKTPVELAKFFLKAIYDETKLYATCGIGPNLFLAKLALDIEAKHAIDYIGIVDEKIFKEKLWYHEPITDIWNISHGIANRLMRYRAYNLHDITLIDESLLYKEFGINAELIIDHAFGREPCTIEDIHNYKSKSNSLSNSQILFHDYKVQDAYLVLKEMVDLYSLELVDKGLVTNNISLSIGYSKDIHKSTGGSMKLDSYTSSRTDLIKYFTVLFNKHVEDYPIRRLSISFNNVVDEVYETVDLFTDQEQKNKEKRVQHTLIDLKKKYGKNVVIKGMDLMDEATTIKRNKLIGGHNAGKDE